MTDKPCRGKSAFGRCGRSLKHSGPHATFIGGGSDPIDDPDVWFGWERRTMLPLGYLVARLTDKTGEVIA